MAIEVIKKKKPAPRDINLKNVSQLHDVLWPIFSEYIRTRDCWRTCGGKKIEVERKDGSVEEILVGRCVTCGHEYPLIKLQAGHYVAGRHPSILYEEKNCHAQCYACNVRKHGDVLNYRDFMIKEYGEELTEDLRVRDREMKKFTKEELIGLIETFSCKLKELKERKDGLDLWD